MPTKRKRTFAEIVEEVVEAPAAPIEVRAGSFNRAGQFFDPAGVLLTRQSDSITPAKAATLVAAGAQVAFEGCGCGGFAGGCIPQWLATGRLAGKPNFVKGYGSPTWIDSWSGEGSTVVFLHGDVKWGDEL